jgi:hypothetical protein
VLLYCSGWRRAWYMISSPTQLPMPDMFAETRS